MNSMDQTTIKQIDTSHATTDAPAPYSRRELPREATCHTVMPHAKFGLATLLCEGVFDLAAKA